MSEPPGIILILLPSLPDFSPSTQILLEENYRSTGAILQAALVVVQEGLPSRLLSARIQTESSRTFADKNRIDKTLTPTHAFGISPVLRQLPNAIDEADYIAGQIKHLIPHSGNLFDYGDFAILIRFQALSRNLETSLQKTGIPSRMVGGSKFFERKEYVLRIPFFSNSLCPSPPNNAPLLEYKICSRICNWLILPPIHPPSIE